MDIKLTENCTGCFACQAICAQGAITCIRDEKGFYKPLINETKCVGCGACMKVCPQEVRINFREPINAYVAIAKEKKVLAQCSSGGAFGVFANYVLENGGAVGGCRLEDGKTARQVIVEDPEELPQLYGSKYVQSCADGYIKHLRKLARGGRQLLVCGTPCQINGAKQIIGDKANVIYVDFICHGVTSSGLLAHHLSAYEKKNHCSVTNLNFRSKEKTPWGVFCAKYTRRDENPDYLKGSVDPYYATFLGMNAYSDSCYTCPYSQRLRASDITIGDAWGCEAYCSEEINQNRAGGVSCIIVNSEKGSEFMKQVLDRFMDEEVPYDNVVQFQKNLHEPSKRSQACFYDKNIEDSAYYLKKMKDQIKLKDKLKGLVPMATVEKIKKLIRR